MGLLAGIGDFGLSEILKDIEDVANKTSKGYFNPLTNSTIDGALTNSPNSSFINGTFYEVDVEGPSPISGANFSAGYSLKKGDRIVKIGSVWNLQPNPETDYLRGQITDLQKDTKVITHVIGETVEGFANNNGDVNAATRVIAIPNTVSANETGLRFKVKPDPTWKAGDLLYIEAIVTENVPNSTLYKGQQIKFNIDVKRGSATVTDAAASTKYSRISSTKLLVSFTYLITSSDTEFAYILQKPAGSALNDSGSSWLWSVNEINQHITKLNETLPPIPAELHNLSLRIDENVSDLQNSQLAYLANSVDIYNDLRNGGIFSQNTLTVPVGSHGANSSIGMKIKLSDSPYYSKMMGKRISCEYIATVSPDLRTKRALSCQAFVRINGEFFPGKALDFKVTDIDSEHIKISFDIVVEPNLTEIQTYLEFYDTVVAVGSAQKIQLSGKFYFFWSDASEKNINTTVLEDTLNSFKEDILENIGSVSSSFAGKKIVWCGTSIPWYYQPNSYPDIVCRRLGATVYNTAIAGSRMFFDVSLHIPGMTGTIAENTALHPDFAAQSYENTVMQHLANGADTVVIDHGYNDAAYMPNYLGLITDTTKNTFYGAYDFLIKQILNNYPDTRIILVVFPGKYPQIQNPTHVSLFDVIINALKELSKKWGFPLINLTEYMGWNTITQVAGKKTIDGTHQTEEETENIANVLYRFMVSIS